MKIKVRKKVKEESKHAIVNNDHKTQTLCGEEKPWFITSIALGVTCEKCLVALDAGLESGELVVSEPPQYIILKKTNKQSPIQAP